MRRTDAEIFRENVKRICKEKDLRMTKIDKAVGYYPGNVTMMAVRGASVTTMHIKRYAKALGVEPWRLTEGMFE